MSMKKQVRVYLSDHPELLLEPTAIVVASLLPEFTDISPRTLARYVQEFRKGETIEVETTSHKEEVFKILELHPEIVGLQTKDAKEEVKGLLPEDVKLTDSTIGRYIQAYRKKIEIDENVDATGDYWYRYDEDSRTYTICAGKAQWSDIPAQEVQDWVQNYTYMGARKSQSVIARRSAIAGRPITRKQVQGIFKALGVTKDSLPIAPHVVESSVEDAAEKVWEAKLAAVESKVRFDGEVRWRKEYEKLQKKYSEMSQLAETIAESIQETPSLSLPPLAFDKKKTPYHGVLFISDWHVGEAFESPLGTFNKSVFLHRVHKLCADVHDLLDNQKRPLSSLSIAIGGDMVDGVLEMRPGHRLEQDVWGGQQVAVAANAISWLIESLWSRLQCPVNVYSVGGNHDRAGGSRDHDPTRIIAQWLCQVAQEKLPEEIAWQHETGEVNQWYLGDTMMLLSHGDHTPSDPKKLTDVYRQTHVSSYVILTGHRHTPCYSEARETLHVQSGSMVGPDPYAGNRYGNTSLPSQIWMEVPISGSGRRPRTLILPVDD